MTHSQSHAAQSHVAIVTGSNHGIGAATARALAAAGSAVLCAYWVVHDPVDPAVPEAYRAGRARDAEHVVRAIRADGGRTAAIPADLRNPAAPAALFDFAEEELGPVDILINNASGWVQDTFAPPPTDRIGPATATVSAAVSAGVTEQTWQQQFAVDAMAPALLIAEFARRHVARGASWGRIVGLTSGGELGFPDEVSYGAAKAAQENYTMSAAAELAPYGITANMVHPPVTDTGWVTDPVRAAVAGSTTLTHVASPEAVAEVIAYLASDAAALISGNILRLR